MTEISSNKHKMNTICKEAHKCGAGYTHVRGNVARTFYFILVRKEVTTPRSKTCEHNDYLTSGHNNLLYCARHMP